jgi:ATP-dependent Clp protease ATP-binding subunit ClpA
MATSPVSLDGLIAYVKTMTPDGGPLENLSDAVTVGTDLDDKSDALIGHFVDAARRSGASWKQIGVSMGVTKQAAQKRFVSQWENAEFSRFTQRSRNVLAAAGQIAEGAGAEVIDASHLAAGLLSEPDGLAARAIHGAGLTDEQVLGALRLPAPISVRPAAGTANAADTANGADAAEGASPAGLRQLRFTEAGRAALRGALKEALRLGHNYIGTEHLLLGILFANGDAGQLLIGLGLTAGQAEQALASEFARIQTERGGSS